MRMSETIDQISDALAHAQRDLQAADRSRTNDRLRNRYATLDDVWTLLRPINARHGLAVVMCPRITDKHCTFDVRVLHTSGQWMAFEGGIDVPEPPRNREGKAVVNEAQMGGQAVTYGQRYILQALYGMAGEDTDAEVGSGDDPPEPPAKPDTTWKPNDRKRFMAKCSEHDLTYEAVAAYFEAHPDYGVRPSAMTQPERDKIEAHMGVLAMRIGGAE